MNTNESVLTEFDEKKRIAEANGYKLTDEQIKSFLLTALLAKDTQIAEAERRGYEKGFVEGQKHAFGVDRKAVQQEGRNMAVADILFGLNKEAQIPNNLMDIEEGRVKALYLKNVVDIVESALQEKL